MKAKFAVSYLGSVPSTRTLDEVLVCVYEGADELSFPSIVSVLELGQLEDRPVLLVCEKLAPAGLATLRINAATVLVVPVRLDEAARAELVRVSDAKVLAPGAKVARSDAGSLARAYAEPETLEVFSSEGFVREPPPAPPPVPRVREDWVALAREKRAPELVTPLDDACWRLAQKLARLDGYARATGPNDLPFEYEYAGPVEPAQIAEAEAALEATLPDELVAMALRLGARVDVGLQGAFEWQQPLAEQTFADGKRTQRAVRVGRDVCEPSDDGEDYGRVYAWLAIDGNRRGEIRLVYTSHVNGSSNTVHAGPKPRGLLEWFDGLVQVCLNIGNVE